MDTIQNTDTVAGGLACLGAQYGVRYLHSPQWRHTGVLQHGYGTHPELQCGEDRRWTGEDFFGGREGRQQCGVSVEIGGNNIQNQA